MFVIGLGTSNPPQRYSKSECWEAFKASEWFNRLDRRSHLIAENVLTRDNGIATRTLALDSLDEVFAIDPDTLARRFDTHAPALAADAGRSALAAAGLAADAIDAVVVSTCTGYLCPGLTSHVIERLGLRRDVQAFDLVGQGCAAALPNWQLAAALLAAETAENVLSICVEVSSAAMYLDDDPGVLISACLFGDGAGAAVLSPAAEGEPSIIDFTHEIDGHGGQALMMPAGGSKRPASHETVDERLHFVKQDGQTVFKFAVKKNQEIALRLLDRNKLQGSDLDLYVSHQANRRIIEATAERLGLGMDKVVINLEMFGNTTAGTIPLALADARRSGRLKKGDLVLLASVGAGFTVGSVLLRWSL